MDVATMISPTKPQAVCFCCGHLGLLNLDMTSEGWRRDLRHTEGLCTLTEKQLAYHSAYLPKSINCLIVLIYSNEDYNLQRERHVVIHKCWSWLAIQTINSSDKRLLGSKSKQEHHHFPIDFYTLPEWKNPSLQRTHLHCSRIQW